MSYNYGLARTGAATDCNLPNWVAVNVAPPLMSYNRRLLAAAFAFVSAVNVIRSANMFGGLT